MDLFFVGKSPTFRHHSKPHLSGRIPNPTIKQAETLRVPAGESRRNLYVLHMWPSWIIHEFWGNYDVPYYTMMISFLIEILQSNETYFAFACLLYFLYVVLWPRHLHLDDLVCPFWKHHSHGKRQVPQLYANGIMRPIMEFLAGGPLL